MSELINNSRTRVDELKRLILEMHSGKTVDETRGKLMELMGAVPYGEVVQAEQELISEGLPETEVLKFCDIHTAALKGHIDTEHQKEVEEGHPVDVMRMENRAIEGVISQIRKVFLDIYQKESEEDCKNSFLQLREFFNQLMDVEKHYVRKENLLFPFLEKLGITGPPAVMWGKHDEIRAFLKSSLQLFQSDEKISASVLADFILMMFEPTINAITEMIYKEDNILFPMSLDTLTDNDWYEIHQQSALIGFTLIVPKTNWKPENVQESKADEMMNGRVQLSTGSFSVKELDALFKSLPLDITFVDKDDKVVYFSEGKERIFERSLAIIGRKVQFCHPPSSVHIVEKILDDFKSGKQDAAKFWISMKGMFVHIAYYAVRNEAKEYLGTLEVTQNIAEYRSLQGERRLLTYDSE